MNVYPSITGYVWTPTISPVWNSQVQKTVSGRVVAATYQQYPLYKFVVQYATLAQADFNTLLAFFNQQQGNVIPFLFDAGPGNDSVTAQSIGTGNGTQTAFQLLRSYAGFAEPVAAAIGTPTVFVNGIEEYPAPLASPSAPALSQVSGGSLAARTNYVKITYLSANGETLGSTEASLAISANHLLKVASPSAETGARSWNVYVSVSTGTETLQANVAIGTAWTEPTGGLVSGAALPSVNDTGWSIGSTGIVTFNDAPAVSAVLTWTGSYYFQCRFSKGTEDFDQFMSQLYKTKSVSMETYW